MSTSYVLLEIKTPRESDYSPSAVLQFLNAIPKLQDNWWHHIAGTDEHFSLEIISENQTVTFLCAAPERVAEYVRTSCIATFPQALITYLEVDPMKSWFSSGEPFALGALSAQADAVFKKNGESSDADSLLPTLGVLTSLEPGEKAAVQIVLGRSTRMKTAGDASATTPEHKMSEAIFRVSTRCITVSTTLDRSKQLLVSLSSAYMSSVGKEAGMVTLAQPFLFKQEWLRHIQNRSFGLLPRFNLTTEELAVFWHLPSKLVAHLSNIAWGKNLLGEPPENLPIVTAAMSAEEKKEINPFARTIYKNASSIYGLRRADRRRHLYVIGKTGTGKSTLLANMAINDLKNDEGLCVIDPHGDLVENLLNFIPSRRINDVIYFDPADPERTVKLNLFEGENVVHRELIASGIVSIFQKLYAYSWGPRLEYILRNALLTLLKSEEARMSDIIDLLTNDAYREKVVANLDDPILKNFWEAEYNRMPDKLRSESIAPILNKVGQFVSSPLVRNVVNATKSSFSIEEVMDSGKILLVNLSQGKLGEDNATLLGAMLITKIQLATMARVATEEEERRDFYLYVDEFQNFATQSFNKILSEARKYRLNLVLANQYIAQIPEDVQKAIFGNCGSMISFVMGADDANVFEKEYGGQYTGQDLVSLGKHQIINKISINNIISKPFPATTLPLAKSSNLSKDKVIRVSRERWAKKR